MTVVILLLTVGGWLIYSALKGQSLVESLTGVGGDILDAGGGKLGDFGGGGEFPADPTDNATGTFKYGFKGPNAGRLANLTQVAETRYKLKVSQVCRPANASYGSATSLHKECRAADLVGASGDMLAFAKYAKSLGWLDEVFYDPAGLIAPGFDHTDHVHIGA